MHLTKRFSFEAAHNLIGYKGKCANLHGHSYVLEVTVEGEPKHDGMIIDFYDVKKIVEEKIIEKLDHTYLNDIIEQSTAERIALWIWNALHKELSALYEIRLFETEDSWVTYRGK
jgi:6-pyruvoyltetrahydropterin/6-carboxytetrahydropterin synthase